ncbi:ABC transporter permease [Rhodoblastus acidophilus]|uniref:ABC transporter permease n=1 Tax=Candidatus Rhodoblastus alkanivorans TaxID=2954117 RepID=A0ABS9Z7B4_9HYPH|nr:ABC transporter permease [Candidatus Rhodoblastus alkanivorans]MCI4680228.1 ABC transporter permease [Candidatus Rhodoblastus alkanivorans]MCI4683331.1 ABC transporter permease [Candidatus Rhodoblastus alkanivorans]MDI4640644.1 ABC transporter permease [Rhodoblastus acidophilus]
MPSSISAEPAFSVERDGETVRLVLRGAWTIAASRALEKTANALAAAGKGAARVAIDFAGVARLDTAGAWLIDKARAQMAAGGAATEYHSLDSDQSILLREAAYAPPAREPGPRTNLLVDLLVRLGQWAAMIGGNVMTGVSFLGELAAVALRVMLNPSLTRPTSMIYHMENFALRAVPIVATINFLVGCIVEQQGIFQLRRFGASTYAIDLIGVLVLRELGVLLTSIMIAGRSGSAITAELGSMKMREEIDALRVMGMSPTEVLVMPRMLALIFSLPLLTFIADMAALGGGMITAYLYSGISVESFLVRLQDAIGLNTFLVGLIKSPFMALVIGIIACIEGFRVVGSAESLGRQVTVSVVNAIFMVIFVDGLFAIFFAGIHY